MPIKTNKPTVVLAMLGASACIDYGSTTQLASIPGAIFTTTETGSRVDANIYMAKEDVYLDGGPSQRTKSGAAALPEGDYFFQVTDPSGKTLLSTDAIDCRRVHVNAAGVISLVYAGPGNCGHDTGMDSDHPELGAMTVQLMPYLDSPNHGDEYKAWMIPVEEYTGLDSNNSGFPDAPSKTDNYKVRTEPSCGDGNVDDGEECDDGNEDSGDGCSATCQTEICGDGKLDVGEECDDGNLTSGDGCSATCDKERAPCCGDGYQDPGEECDDGNTTNGDGCSSTCQDEPRCGDGAIDSGEACDDGNATNGDGCSSTCQYEPRCGDGSIDSGEACDDGNTTNGDGCSSTCRYEPRCGDGYIDAGEQCDDGNTRSEDGCSSTCQNENVCMGWCPVLL
jgi:cysteine-rich repeat protein